MLPLGNTEGDEYFPLPALVDGGEYVVTEHLYCPGGERLYLGHHKSTGDRTLLVSVMGPPQASLAEMYKMFAYSSPGLFELDHIGMFEPHDSDGSPWLDLCALVEVLPGGAPARQVIRGPVAFGLAVHLGIGVGRILRDAAEGGHLLGDLQPECIWLDDVSGSLEVTGLTGRTWPFFKLTKPRSCAVGWPPFERRYTSPETAAREPSEDRSVSFVLGLLIAEWATGEFPFENAYSHYLDPLMSASPRSLTRLPARLEELLTEALQRTAANRPSIAELVRELEALTPEELQGEARL